MTAARKTARRKTRPPVESAIYDGSLMLGEVLPRRGSFVARLASGRRLGAFATEELAMRAITAAARAARAVSLEISGTRK